MSIATGLLGLAQRALAACGRAVPGAGTGSASRTGGRSGAAPVEVFTTGMRMEAEVVRGLLESRDIPAVIMQEAASLVYPVTVGELAEVRVLVPAALEEQARALLEENPLQDFTEDPPEPSRNG